MEPYINEIARSGWFSVASFVVGALGIVLAIVFYLRTKRMKVLSFEHRSVPIFRDSTPLMSKLEVMYEGKVTKNLTLTHLAFWNSGNETIRDLDLVEDDPLRIEIGEGDILDAELLCETSNANAIRVGDPGNSAISLSFRFLDAQHGGAVRVVHTGASRKQVDLEGTLMGAGTPKEITEGFADYMRRIITRARAKTLSRKEFKWIVTIAVAIISIGMAVFLIFARSSTANIGTLEGPWRFTLLLLLAPYWWVTLSAHRWQVPNELEQYLEDFGTEKKKPDKTNGADA